jgi:hypothetical protein
MRSLLTRRARQPADHLDRPHRPGAPGVRQRADDPGQDLASGPEDDGVQMGGERVPEELRGDVSVRGAARVEEERREVGLRGARAVEAQAVGEPHRDQRRVEPVLEREPHPEVRGQAQGRHQLRAPDLLAALRRCGRHAATLLASRLGLSIKPA